MTITLVGPIRVDQAIILVTAPEEMALDKIYQVDQELIILRSAPRSGRVSVGRGMFGSARATHAGGAALTPVSLVAQPGLPVAPPVPPGGGSGGVTVDNGSDPPAAVTTLVAPGAVITGDSATLPLALTMRQFDVAFDDAGFIDPNTGVVLWTPAAGDVVLDLWATVRTRFLGADSAALYIGGNENFDQLLAGAVDLIAVGLPPDPGQDFVNAPGSSSNATLDAAQSSLDIAIDNTISRSLQRVPTQVGSNGTDIIAAVTVTNGPLTAGALRIIAIVGTPAS